MPERSAEQQARKQPLWFPCLFSALPPQRTNTEVLPALQVSCAAIVDGSQHRNKRAFLLTFPPSWSRWSSSDGFPVASVVTAEGIVLLWAVYAVRMMLAHQVPLTPILLEKIDVSQPQQQASSVLKFMNFTPWRKLQVCVCLPTSSLQLSLQFSLLKIISSQSHQILNLFPLQ